MLLGHCHEALDCTVWAALGRFHHRGLDRGGDRRLESLALLLIPELVIVVVLLLLLLSLALFAIDTQLLGRRLDLIKRRLSRLLPRLYSRIGHVHCPVPIVLGIISLGRRHFLPLVPIASILIPPLIILVLVLFAPSLLLCLLTSAILLRLLAARRLVLNPTLGVGRVVEDEGGELVRRVRIPVVAARFAIKDDLLLLADLHRRLRKLATRAKDPLLDELVRLLLQNWCLVPPVDSTRALHGVKGGDSAEFDGAVLDEVLEGPLQRFGHISRVHYHCLLSITDALLLADHSRHFVAVCWIVATTYVEQRHLAARWLCCL
mmetsp:Transcript_2202/g.4519  ORF Transcript_2202/g.4519 Transcript_2202/m.4519 type:complete len:319 (-) Transcript_2202:119-1075(-)